MRGITRRTSVATVGAGMMVGCAQGDSASPPASSNEPLSQAALEGIRKASGGPAMIAVARSAQGGALDLVAGTRSAEAPAVATVGDKWHLGSIGKSITATGIARLVEAGKLSWETPIAGLMPDIAADIRPEYQSVTLVELLTHTSGLEANAPLLEFIEYPALNDDPRDDRTSLARKAFARAPQGPVGNHFLYSNAGFIIAGAVMERATGKPYEQSIVDLVFNPLGMTSVGFGAPMGDQPLGHRKAFIGGRPIPVAREEGGADNPAVLSPAGRMHMTMADLMTYLSAHLDHRADFLAAATWEKLHTPRLENYAMGWVRTPTGALWHNGSNTYWYAEAYFNRSNGKVGAAVTNFADMDRVRPAVSEAMRRVASAIA
jgi:CubicO group peptidase (beta-lactamase class C family)